MWTGSDWETTNKVSRYSTTGWTEDLPDLNTARYSHACSFYTTDSGDKVGFTAVFILIIFGVLRFSLSLVVGMLGTMICPLQKYTGTRPGLFSLLLLYHHLPGIFLLGTLTTPSLSLVRKSISVLIFICYFFLF